MLTGSLWELTNLLFSLLDSPLYICLHLNKLALDTYTHTKIIYMQLA